LPAGPYLIVLAFASNIGGTATLIGDPPNIIIASRAGLSFADFLLHLTRSSSCCWSPSPLCAGCSSGDG
jgi:Na+/H+ antiporter NhaD/arsenite permease-like protein